MADSPGVEVICRGRTGRGLIQLPDAGRSWSFTVRTSPISHPEQTVDLVESVSFLQRKPNRKKAGSQS